MNPPFQITGQILEEISKIERLLGRVESLEHPKPQPHLRKSNRVRTVQGSLAIEGNTLSKNQITALIEGKTVIGNADEIQSVLNPPPQKHVYNGQKHISGIINLPARTI